MCPYVKNLKKIIKKADPGAAEEADTVSEVIHVGSELNLRKRFVAKVLERKCSVTA